MFGDIDGSGYPGTDLLAAVDHMGLHLVTLGLLIHIFTIQRVFNLMITIITLEG